MTFEIKDLCEADPLLSGDLLSAIDKEHWAINLSRQKEFKAHRDTETIRLRHVRNFSFNNFKFINYEMFQYYRPFTDRYLEIISQHFSIKDYTALIVNLKPKSFIATHSDRGSRYFQLGHRLHIPIKTNGGVIFAVGESKINMKTGRIYEINNLAPHSVKNHSAENRIHLIMDIFDTNMKEYPEYWMDAIDALKFQYLASSKQVGNQ